MIRADLDPSTAGTVDPNANGPSLAGYWTTGPICTTFGPDAANHIQEEIARAIEGSGLELDFSDKGQLAGILSRITGVYGDGSDGTVTLPAGLTQILRDMHYESLTIPAGSSLNTNGHRVFVRDVLTMEQTAEIMNSGSPGGDYTGGPVGGSGGGGTIAQALGGGGSGGVGGNTPGNADPAAPPARVGTTGSPVGLISSNGQGYAGNGGQGGNGSPGVNEAGANPAAVDAPQVARPTFLPAMVDGQLFTALGRNMLCGGAGGGGGGAGDGAADPNGFGGGGGGGGGVLVLCARVIVGPSAPDTAAFISAAGGDGGSDLTLGASQGGGGGGGGGGTVLVTSRIRVGDPGLMILDASQGAGGTATTAANGTQGTAGEVFELFA